MNTVNLPTNTVPPKWTLHFSQFARTAVCCPEKCWAMELRREEEGFRVLGQILKQRPQFILLPMRAQRSDGDVARVSAGEIFGNLFKPTAPARHPPRRRR